MVKALYGHPDAGGLWERDLRDVMMHLGFGQIGDWGTTF